jgi:hypothetical protein
MDRTRSERFPLRRREVASALLADRGDLLVVAGLGSTAWDVTAAGDHPLNFPLWGPWAARPRSGSVWHWRSRTVGCW